MFCMRWEKCNSGVFKFYVQIIEIKYVVSSLWQYLHGKCVLQNRKRQKMLSASTKLGALCLHFLFSLLA
jgi:hypothetical protein